MTHQPSERHIHQGRNVKKFREMMSLSQDGLADRLGDDWTQKKISQLESKEHIEDAILEQISKALRVPKETLENTDVQEAVVNIQHNYEGSNNNGPINNNGVQNINPVEEWMKALDKNEALYERLLKSEQEKVTMLQGLLKNNK